MTGARLIESEALDGYELRDDDLVVFIDDDDWLHRDLFGVIRGAPDGAMWGNIIIGGEFLDRPSRPIELRAIKPWLFTNNYAVGGRTLKTVGRAATLEHNDAQRQFEAARFRPAVIRRYLSATNKHPCSALAAQRHLRNGFRENPRQAIIDRRDELASEALTHDTDWMAKEIAALIALLSDTLA